MNYKFKDGSMWEGGFIEIEENYKCSQNGGGEPCKHCHSEETLIHTTSYDKSTYTERIWVCPYVVIASNEGGHNSTGVCLDCIIEAAKTIGK